MSRFNHFCTEYYLKDVSYHLLYIPNPYNHRLILGKELFHPVNHFFHILKCSLKDLEDFEDERYLGTFSTFDDASSYAESLLSCSAGDCVGDWVDIGFDTEGSLSRRGFLLPIGCECEHLELRGDTLLSGVVDSSEFSIDRDGYYLLYSHNYNYDRGSLSGSLGLGGVYLRPPNYLHPVHVYCLIPASHILLRSVFNSVSNVSGVFYRGFFPTKESAFLFVSDSLSLSSPLSASDWSASLLRPPSGSIHPFSEKGLLYPFLCECRHSDLCGDHTGYSYAYSIEERAIASLLHSSDILSLVRPFDSVVFNNKTGKLVRFFATHTEDVSILDSLDKLVESDPDYAHISVTDSMISLAMDLGKDSQA